jgi:ribosomal protein L32
MAKCPKCGGKDYDHYICDECGHNGYLLKEIEREIEK